MKKQKQIQIGIEETTNLLEKKPISGEENDRISDFKQIIAKKKKKIVSFLTNKGLKDII